MDRKLKVFTCIDHAGHWGVPVASIVAAHDEIEAHDLLCAALRDSGLPHPEMHAMTFAEFDVSFARALVLSDG